jgi:hypothetical protein
MEKNIKDYLHLYIGCRAEATTVEGAVSNVAISYTLLHDWDGWLERIKPILRKLSSMTEEEFQHMINEGWIGAPTFTNWTKIVYRFSNRKTVLILSDMETTQKTDNEIN